MSDARLDVQVHSRNVEKGYGEINIPTKDQSLVKT